VFNVSLNLVSSQVYYKEIGKIHESLMERNNEFILYKDPENAILGY
jgi:hypothetical protein